MMMMRVNNRYLISGLKRYGIFEILILEESESAFKIQFNDNKNDLEWILKSTMKDDEEFEMTIIDDLGNLSDNDWTTFDDCDSNCTCGCCDIDLN